MIYILLEFIIKYGDHYNRSQ